MDARSAPQRIRVGHATNEFTNLATHRGSAPTTASRDPSPVALERLSMPANYGGRLDKHKNALPVVPEPSEDDPEETIRLLETRPVRPALQDGQLLSQREVLREQVTATADGRSSRSEEESTEFGHRLALPGPMP